jgi:hypothetical protein
MSGQVRRQGRVVGHHSQAFAGIDTSKSRHLQRIAGESCLRECRTKASQQAEWRTRLSAQPAIRGIDRVGSPGYWRRSVVSPTQG